MAAGSRPLQCMEMVDRAYEIAEKADTDEIRRKCVGVVLSKVNSGLSYELSAICSVVEEIKSLKEQARQIFDVARHLLPRIQEYSTILDIAHRERASRKASEVPPGAASLSAWSACAANPRHKLQRVSV